MKKNMERKEEPTGESLTDGEIPSVEIPVDGVLDLHTFRPGEVKDLIPEYLEECRKRGVRDVRVIHGKGRGSMRRTVHAILGRLPAVDSFRLAGDDAGGWGATLVVLSLEESEKS